MVIKECEWLCENAKSLETYSGKWVLFLPDQGIVGCAQTFKKAVAQANKSRCREKPFLFHVPTPEDVQAVFR